MFETFALLGGFWFFLLVVFVFIAGAVSCEYDSITGGLITIGFLIGGLQLLGWPVFATLFASPLSILLILTGYIVGGAAYAVFWRYPRYLKKNKGEIQRKYEQWENRKDKEDGESFETSEWFERFRPGSNIDRITSWVMLWPWGAAWDLTHHPIIWIYDVCYEYIGKALDRVAKRFVQKNILK